MMTYRSGGMAGLIAALVGVAGMAATAAGVYPAQLYVSDGLIAQWDGIDNAGIGAHVSDTNKWFDLIGTRHLALRTDCASFTNGNALACFATSGYSAGPAAACSTYKTIEFVGTPQPAGHKTQAFPFCGGAATRAIIFETGFSATMYSTYYRIWSNEPTTLAVTYDGDTPSNYYDHATLCTGTGSYDNWGSGNAGLCIGERHATATSPYHGQVFAVRLYDRVLTEAELAVDAAIDDVRFFGADPKDVFPGLEFPDGIRWNAETEKVEVRVRVATHLGTASETEAWHPADDSVSIVFTPDMADSRIEWSDLPRGATLSADGRTLTFLAQKSDISVSAWLNQYFTAKSYVQKGLTVQFDGIDNAGTGTHDAEATSWKDLVGTRDLPLTAYGSFQDGKALYCGNTGSSYSAGPAAAYTTYGTIELSCELGPSSKYVFCAGDTTHSRFFAVYGNNFLVKTGEGYWSTSGGHPTMSATYSGADPQGHFANGEESTKMGTDTWGHKGGCMTVGAGYLGGSAFVGNVYLIRLYDRALSQAELRFNAAIDRARYDGTVPAKTTLATASLPEGYVWDEYYGALRVKVRAEVPRGSAAFAGASAEIVTEAASGSTATGLAVLGRTVTATFAVPAGVTVRRFTGLPSDATVTETATGLSVSFVANGPTYIALDAYDPAAADELAIATSDEGGTTRTETRTKTCDLAGIHIGNAGGATGVPSSSGVGGAAFVLDGRAQIAATDDAYAFVRPNAGSKLTRAEVFLGDGATLTLLDDLAIEDLTLVGTASVDLNGHALTIYGERHTDGAGWDPQATVPDSGISWCKRPQSIIFVR